MPPDPDTIKRMKLAPSSIVQVELEIVGYFDEGGELKLATRCIADSPISTVVGLMEQTKHSLLAAWDQHSEMESFPDEEDDDGEG